MKNQHITEVIAYAIKPETDIKVMRDLINEMIRNFDGFVSQTTLQHISEPYTFVDLVVWTSEDAAKKAAEDFHAHPKFNEIGSMYTETKFFAQYKTID